MNKKTWDVRARKAPNKWDTRVRKGQGTKGGRPCRASNLAQNYLALGKSKSNKQCSETTKNESVAKIV